jgi:hypothetical protein
VGVKVLIGPYTSQAPSIKIALSIMRVTTHILVLIYQHPCLLVLPLRTKYRTHCDYVVSSQLHQLFKNNLTTVFNSAGSKFAKLPILRRLILCYHETSDSI